MFDPDEFADPEQMRPRQAILDVMTRFGQGRLWLANYSDDAWFRARAWLEINRSDYLVILGTFLTDDGREISGAPKVFSTANPGCENEMESPLVAWLEIAGKAMEKIVYSGHRVRDCVEFSERMAQALASELA